MDPHIQLSESTSGPNAKRKRVDDSPNDYSSFRDELIKMFEDWTAKQDKQMQKLFPILNGIQTANSTIESSISFLTEQNLDFKKKLEQLEIEIKKKNEYIIFIEDRLEELTRNSRKTTIEIKNVPLNSKETKEGMVKLVENLSKSIELNLDVKDIKDIYKSRSQTEKKTIIVELNSTFTKDNILKSAKAYNIRNKSNKLCAKHLGITSSPDTPIFIAENLTPKASRLYFLARDLKKSRNYKYCWTSYGRVYVRKEDTSPIILIQSEAQVQKMMND
ncbi:hypothetical protein JYU34_004842 [Plutella xylostella]|uniref:FP protein C-terminal domain-containing protein n=1 Tax=Plutella xylostella TaxID=51655 RepID=A0ABQ7QVA9_PLUXY|nr:hypothetical protein JYU34_004842 [Plutella xylostella]